MIYIEQMILNRFFFLVSLMLTSTACTAQSTFAKQLSDAAVQLTHDKVIYDPSYFSIPYPNGDIPAGRGVCTDVIIRAYRKLGIDLQKNVHEDMVKNFKVYPAKWGMKSTDKNIDHRRVPNLMTFFTRYGYSLPATKLSSDYKPGDIVSWDLGKGITHIGIVIDQKSPDGLRNLIVHNIGYGQEISDCLFQYTIIGHHRYVP